MSVQQGLSKSVLKLVALGLPLLAVACAPSAGKPKPPPTGPFTVSDYFAASGDMGDGDGKPGSGSIATYRDDATKCKARPAGARGSCFAFDYVPGMNLFAGVYWQYPANNWGDTPGLDVKFDEPGKVVTKVSFQAAIKDGTDTLQGDIGGINVDPPVADPVTGVTPPVPAYKDQFHGTDTFSLTTDWQTFTLTIRKDPANPITTLLGAFAWYLKYPMGSDPTTLTPKTLYIDDLVYE